MTTEQQIVKFKADKQNFEVACKPGAVLKYRQGKLGSLDNVILTDVVFKNFSKADRAKNTELIAAFGTDNMMECIKQIVERGEFQLSAGERKEKQVQKKNEIVTYIHKYYIDPRSKLPHPVARIESALEELKVNIDPDAPADRQALEFVKKLLGKLPLKRSEMGATLTIPHQYVAQCASLLRARVSISKENYTTNGCSYVVSMAPGDYDKLLADLNKITKGDFQLNVGNQEQSMPSSDEPIKASGGKGKGRARK